MTRKQVNTDPHLAFAERIVCQTYDRADLGYPDEWQLYLRITDGNEDLLLEQELVYASAPERESESFAHYSDERGKFFKVYPWIPLREERIHHRDGIHANQRWPTRVGDISGQYDPLDLMIQSHEIPFAELPQAHDWITDQKALTEQVIACVKLDPEALRHMHPETFEHLIVGILRDLGYEVQWTGRRADVPGDGIAIAGLAGGLKTAFLLECKRYKCGHPVGIEVADRLYGAMQRTQIPNGLLVTTSNFTSGVKEKYGARWDFHLKDFEALKEWLQQCPLVDRSYLDDLGPFNSCQI